VVGVAVAGVLLGAFGTWQGQRALHDRAERRAVERYDAALLPALKEGGLIIQEGVKPFLNDFRQGKIAPPQFSENADGWLHDLARVRKKVRVIKPPSGLRPAQALFDLAFQGYVNAVTVFQTATAVDANQRERVLLNGIAVAEQADKVYDQAKALLEAAKNR
jgi:hypothetical protein